MKPILTIDTALEYCLKRLAACDITQAALLLKLRQRGCPEEIAQAAVARLRERGYLNDRRSSERLVRMWRRSATTGSAKLSATLRAQGVDASLQAEMLRQVSEDEELEHARRAIARRRIDRGDERWREKLLAYLVRRGFSLSLAQRALAEVPSTPEIGLS